MSDFVTVLLRMHPDDAEGLRECLAPVEALGDPPKVAMRVMLPTGNTRPVGFVARVHRIGSLPEVEAEPLPISATSATRPRGGAVTVPIYERDTQRWVKWHPMAMEYVETEPPKCIADTDGDHNCAMALCPRCGPIRGTL